MKLKLGHETLGMKLTKMKHETQRPSQGNNTLPQRQSNVKKSPKIAQKQPRIKGLGILYYYPSAEDLHTHTLSYA